MKNYKFFVLFISKYIRLYIVLFGLLTFASSFKSYSEINQNQYGQLKEIFTISLKKDTILRVDAKPGSGFNFPYYIFIPAGTKVESEQFLLVETNNTGVVNDTLQFHDAIAKLQAQKNSLGNTISRRLKIPFLVPVFPRSQKNWIVYTHALDRDAILIKSGDNKRLDLQLIAMINDANTTLSPFNISLNKKVLLNGFSASGNFANRFTMIHPEIVAAVASGGISAIPILLINTIEKTNLDYPIGIHDFETIFGVRPNFEIYKNIPQFIYMGEQDDNDGVLFDDGYSDKESKIIFKVIGEIMLPDRWEKCKSIYKTNGINATFKLYPDIGHGINKKMQLEIAEFFNKVLEP